MIRHNFYTIGLLVPLLVGLLGCAGEHSSKALPAGILPDSVFADLLVDMALAESAANLNIKAVNNSQFDSVYAFRPLIEHGIRKSQYDSTLIYYSSHIEEYKAVYNDVLDRLSAMQALQVK